MQRFMLVPDKVLEDRGNNAALSVEKPPSVSKKQVGVAQTWRRYERHAVPEEAVYNMKNLSVPRQHVGYSILAIDVDGSW